jgi:hypothetical protein
VASSCTLRFLPWRRRIFFISARTILSLTATNESANAAITFLMMNDWEPLFDEQELVDLVLAVASGGLRKPGLIEIFELRCSPGTEGR